MKFYKYPECEPKISVFYLCVARYKDLENHCTWGVFEYKPDIGFICMDGWEVVAYTNLTAEEAAQNAEI